MRKYHSITHCRACRAQSDSLFSVFAMRPMPLAGAFSVTREEARSEPCYPLTWVQCGGCAAVQVLEDIPDEVLFQTYNYASSTIEGLVRHFAEFSLQLRVRYGTERITLLEIGCNDGVLLKKLPRKWKLIGVDPSDVARHAVQDGADYELINAPFTSRLVADNELAGRVDVISASNCLAHISDIRAVFEAVHAALCDGGEFWVEVHDLDALLRGSQWDTVYHEHRLEWSTRSLQYCLKGIGFQMIEISRHPLHGGLLRCCFRKARQPQPGDAEGIRPSPTEAEGLAALRSAYGSRYDTPVSVALRHALKNGEAIAAYGASGRASVYMNQLPELMFSYVVDESPARAGRFLPGVAVPIVTTDTFRRKPVAHCLISAWNYADDIVRKNPQFRGRWLTAFGES